MVPLRYALFGLLLSATPAPLVCAGTILQPAGVSTSMGELNPGFFPLGGIVDRSGLTANDYTTGEDFDAYIATDPNHVGGGNASWLAGFNQTAGNVDFDLGGTFTIESLALWNYGGGTIQNIGDGNPLTDDFSLIAGDDSIFSNPVVLGSYSANPNTGPISATLAEVFSFAPTEAAFVRLEITNINGGTFAGTGEVAFEAVEIVPEPATLYLAGIGLAFIFIVLFRRQLS